MSITVNFSTIPMNTIIVGEEKTELVKKNQISLIRWMTAKGAHLSTL